MSTEDTITLAEYALNDEKENIQNGINSLPEQKSNLVFKYECDWQSFFSKANIRNLSKIALTGQLRASRFRSVCWRVLLNIFGDDFSEWVEQLKSSRDTYEYSKKQLHLNPWESTVNLLVENPLSQNPHSEWNKFFQDQELYNVIKQDVIRTFPGIDFFRKHFIQTIMVDVLFTYARLNPVMCYRQGMHEILAPILFVLHCDHQALSHVKEYGIVSPVIEEVLNPNFLENDAFILFSKIMSQIGFCYNIKNLEPTKTGYFPTEAVQVQNLAKNQNQNNEVIIRLNYICENLLKASDFELYSHLVSLDIPLHIFGIRWLRLLFGREFPLQDLLILWDAIFSERQGFDFVNYIFVSMLIAIRNQLLHSDYMDCLKYLMHYPNVFDIMYIIEYALYLKYPSDYGPPSMVPSQMQSKHLEQIAENRLKRQSSRNKVSLKKLNQTDNYNLATDTVNSVKDGYRLQDPEILRLELEHSRNVMALCQLKLAQYHKILENIAIESSKVNDLQMVIEGISELCHLLNTRHYENIEEIEPALEANELKQSNNKKQSQKVVQIKQKSRSFNSYVKTDELFLKPDKVLYTFKHIKNPPDYKISDCPMEDPLSKLKENNFVECSDKLFREAILNLNS